MERSTKEAWLTGPGDLETREVPDVPGKGQSVTVQALAGNYSRQAISEAIEYKETPKGDRIATINTTRLDVLKFAYGCVEPTFSVPEAEIVSKKWGPAFDRVVDVINELSNLDEEALEAAEARFPSERAGQNGTDLGDAAPARSGRPNVST